MNKMRKIFVWVIGFCLFAVPLAYGQNFPSKPIEFILGYPPGGTHDIQARPLCAAAEKILGQPVLVESKSGVGGVVAIDYLIKQKPDGYQLAQVSLNALIGIKYFQKVPYTLDDFTWIMGFGPHLHGLSVRADAPWNTFREFLDYAKKNPGKVKYGTYSPESTTQIVMYSIAKAEGIDWIHVPFKGDAPAMTAVLGGHVDAVAVAAGQVPFVRSKKVKLLAIFNDDKHRDLKNIPAFKELGYSFPEMSNKSTYTGIVGPKGMKPEIRQKLEDAFLQATKDPNFIKIEDFLMSPIISKTGKEYEAYVRSSDQVFGKIMPAIAAEMKK